MEKDRNIYVFLRAGRPTSISLMFSFMDNEIEALFMCNVPATLVEYETESANICNLLLACSGRYSPIFSVMLIVHSKCDSRFTGVKFCEFCLFANYV